MNTSIRFRLVLVLLVLVCTVGCDQMSKHMARNGLAAERVSALSGGLIELTLAENPGAFLSLGESLPAAAKGLVSVGMSVGIALLLAHLVRGSSFHRWQFVGLLLASAGGVSNLVDRFARHGLVTDFMIVRCGPIHTGIFNLADVVIVIGIVILGVSGLAGHDKKGNDKKG